MGDMRKVPCSECPFKKGSLRGYTGPHDSGAEMAAIVWGDGRFPCHMAVTVLTDRGRPFVNAASEASPCAGAAAMMNNGCKRSRHPDMAAAQDVVGRRDDVFARPAEMSDWHDNVPHPRRPSQTDPGGDE